MCFYVLRSSCVFKCYTAAVTAVFTYISQSIRDTAVAAALDDLLTKSVQLDLYTRRRAAVASGVTQLRDTGSVTAVCLQTPPNTAVASQLRAYEGSSARLEFHNCLKQLLTSDPNTALPQYTGTASYYTLRHRASERASEGVQRTLRERNLDTHSVGRPRHVARPSGIQIVL